MANLVTDFQQVHGDAADADQEGRRIDQDRR